MSVVSLLSCGGSVLESWKSYPINVVTMDVVVGVNWVGELFQTDYLCLKDSVVVDRGRLIVPRIGFVDNGHIPRHWKGGRSYDNFERWDRVTGWGGPSICGYTFPDALRWCLEKWPDREVRVYGCDMDGDPCVGSTAEGSTFNHSVDRWSREYPFIRHMVKLHGDRVKFVGCRMGDMIKEADG